MSIGVSWVFVKLCHHDEHMGAAVRIAQMAVIV